MSSAFLSGTKALSKIGSVLLEELVSRGISKLSEGFNYLLTYEERQNELFKKAKTATKESADAMRSLKSEISSTTSETSKLASEFARLVQGVNPFTNQNRKLSTEDYEKFLAVNNQLAELFPSLRTQYDENGNAILGLSGSVDTVTASIARLTEQQKALEKGALRRQLEEYFDGTEDHEGAFQALNGYKKDIQDIEGDIASLKSAYYAIMNGYDTVILKDYSHSKESDKYSDNIKGQFRKSLYPIFSDAKMQDIQNGNGNSTELSQETRDKITEVYNIYYQDLQTSLSIAKAELEAKNKEISDTIMEWVKDLEQYKNSDPLVKKAYETMVGSIPWSELGVEEGDYDTAKQKVLSLIRKLDAAIKKSDKKSETINALSGLFSTDFSKMNYTDANEKIKGYLTKIMDAFNDEKEQKTLLDMYDMFGFGSYDQTAVDMKRSVTRLSLGSPGPLPFNLMEYAVLTKYTHGFNQAQTEAWLASTAGARNAAEAVQLYKKHLEQTQEKTNKTKDQYTDIVNFQEKMSTFQRGAGSIRPLYEEFQTKGFATAESIESLPDEIKSLPSYDFFSKIAGNPNSGKEKIREAFNSIISEYMKSQETLEGMTEQTQSSTIANLEAAGIQNAPEVVSQYIKQGNEMERKMNHLADITGKFQSEEFASFAKSINEKGKISAEFANKIGQNNASMINGLSKQYQTDLLNWLDLCRKKKEAYDILAGAVGGKNTKEAKSNHIKKPKRGQVLHRKNSLASL